MLRLLATCDWESPLDLWTLKMGYILLKNALLSGAKCKHDIIEESLGFFLVIMLFFGQQNALRNLCEISP